MRISFKVDGYPENIDVQEKGKIRSQMHKAMQKQIIFQLSQGTSLSGQHFQTNYSPVCKNSMHYITQDGYPDDLKARIMKAFNVGLIMGNDRVLKDKKVVLI